jgi:predicted alpha/beta hydrolase family esterase
MKNAIILHGRAGKADYYGDKYPSESNSHWLPWLQKQLIRKDIHAQTPEIFESYEPTYEKWAREIEKYSPNTDTILVGHSCGGGMVVQWLSKNPDARVGKVVLVAPWIDIEKENWPAFDFKIDEALVSRTAGLTIYHSVDDVAEIQTSVKELREKLKGAKYVEFHDHGHFTLKGMGGKTEFPELLKECLVGKT